MSNTCITQYSKENNYRNITVHTSPGDVNLDGFTSVARCFKYFA